MSDGATCMLRTALLKKKIGGFFQVCPFLIHLTLIFFNHNEFLVYFGKCLFEVSFTMKVTLYIRKGNDSNIVTAPLSMDLSLCLFSLQKSGWSLCWCSTQETHEVFITTWTKTSP